MWALQEDQILLNLHRPFQPICPIQQLAGASQPYFAHPPSPSLPFLLDEYGADALASNPYVFRPSGVSYPSFPIDSLFSDTSNPQIQAPACSVVDSDEGYSKYSCISDFLGLNDPAMVSVSCSNLLQCMEPVSSVEESTALLGSFNRMHTLQIPYNLPQEEVQSSMSVVQNCYNQQYDQICEMGHVDPMLLQNMMQNEGLGFDLLPDLQAVDEFSHSSVTMHHQGTNPSPFMGAMDCINEAGSPGCSSLTDAETDCSVHSDRPMKRQRILDNPLLQKSIAHNNFCKNQETQQPIRSSGQVEPIRSLDLPHSLRSVGAISSSRSKILAENCTGLQIINKQKQPISSVEPQSIVARERRKKISERVSILQKLIPGGNKLDTASMLDEAIRFVKFLQLQVQVLESLGDGDPNSGANLRSSSSLILSETMQHALFKHNRCIASIRQCPSENLHQALG